MLRGLWKLTWLEIKIFMREPLGLFGAVGVPVLVVVVLGRMLGGGEGPRPRDTGFVGVGLPVFTAILIALGAVTSLVTIIAIYREGGILKRLRATPLHPVTILTAHVIVKLLLTVVTLVMALLSGRQYFSVGLDARLVGFAAALLIATVSILSLGFLVASLVPTARFAQPVAGLILWPMVALSGLFMPIASLPPPLQTAARWQPLTYVVSLLEGIWTGEPWAAHLGDVLVLAGVFVLCTALSSKLFRWE